MSKGYGEKQVMRPSNSVLYFVQQSTYYWDPAHTVQQPFWDPLMWEKPIMFPTYRIKANFNRLILRMEYSESKRRVEIKCWIFEHSRQVGLLSSIVFQFYFSANIIMSFFKVSLEINVRTEKFFPSWPLSDVGKPPSSTVLELTLHCLEISNVETPLHSKMST